MKKLLILTFSLYSIHLIAGCTTSMPVLPAPNELDSFSNTIAYSVGKATVATDIATRTKLSLKEINFAALTNRQQLLCAAIAHYTNPKKNTGSANHTPLIILKRAMNLEGTTVLATMPSPLKEKLSAYLATKIPTLQLGLTKEEEKDDQ